MRRELSIWLILAVLLGGFASSVRAADADVASPLTSYVYLDTLAETPLQPNVVSPLVSYLYYDWLGDENLTFQNSLLVSFYFQPSTATGQIALGGRVTDTIGVVISGATISATVGLTPAAQTTTDASGNYALPPLGAGVYALAVSAAGHAKSARVLTLSAGTATQSFQLASLPAAPGQQVVDRSPTVNYTAGQMGELTVFDGTNFVAINGGNAPQSDRMTIVMTHGFDSNPEAWAKGMAERMQAQGVANILCWDWRAAAVPLAEAYGRTGDQGVALGRQLQFRLGVGYFKELHFLGHSLGSLVNAAAVNYLRGDKLGHEDVSSTRWISNPIHVTLFDHAERANVLYQDVPYDGLSLTLVDAVDRLESGANYTWDYKRSMPVHPTWADNYVSLFGFFHSKAVNVKLKKSFSALNVVNPHSYAWWWYSNSVANPTDALNPLGFQRSYEYVRAVGLPASTFPPSNTEFSPGTSYRQVMSSPDLLALERYETLGQQIGTLANNVVHGTIAAVQTVGNVAVEIRDRAQAAGQWIVGGFDYVGNVALDGGQSLLNLFDSAVLRLQLLTTPPSSPGPLALRGGPRPLDGGGTSNSPPMAWLPIQFPSNATAMAFDFTVEGDPVDDVLVCGIGTNSLFSLEAKYIPTNAMSASRLIDVTAWAGTTNELFFGFLCGTSTNATFTIENIRFFSLAEPRLEIFVSGSTTLLSWPLTAGGYVLETTPTLASATWETVTNAPAISADRYVLTNTLSDQSRFFRLRAR